MAGTTFKAIREWAAQLIESTDPTLKEYLPYKEVEDINLIEDSVLDESIFRRFQVDSGGIKSFQGVLTYSLVADSHKEMVLTMVYPKIDNDKTMRDLADEDENLIIRTLQDPTNRPPGMLHIALETTNHTQVDGWRIIEYTFNVHYNHC